jgi:hypothetical protein
MAFERKNNTASAFKNEKKEQPTHADLTGSGLINGVHYWVNVWKNADKNGNTSINMTFKEKDADPQEKKELDDDLPF